DLAPVLDRAARRVEGEDDPAPIGLVAIEGGRDALAHRLLHRPAPAEQDPVRLFVDGQGLPGRHISGAGRQLEIAPTEQDAADDGKAFQQVHGPATQSEKVLADFQSMTSAMNSINTRMPAEKINDSV